MSQTAVTPKRTDHIHHHFVDGEQQFDASKMGMWIFLATETLMFGGLFAAYTIYRAWYPELYLEASQELDAFWGTVNTVVLIGSSLTVAMAIRSAQLHQLRGIVYNLYMTIGLAVTFMVIKYCEYAQKIETGIGRWQYYASRRLAHEKANALFSIHYMLTGRHAIHIIIGIGLMIWRLVKATRRVF